MRFIHMADMHFDSPFTVLAQKKGLGNKRRLEQRDIFKKVINYNMNNTTHYINIDVAYDTKIDILEKALNEMREEVEKIDGYVSGYNLLGIQEFASSSIKYMVVLECKYANRFQVKRDFNKILKKYLDKYKIEIPYTKVDVNIRGKHE